MGYDLFSLPHKYSHYRPLAQALCIPSTKKAQG